MPQLPPFLPGLAALLLSVATPSLALEGRVLDARTGEPVPGATVFAFELGTWAVCGPEGGFQLRTDRDALSVEVSHVGYRPGIWEDLPADRPVTLRLVPGITRLGGITVTAHRLPVPADQAGPVSVLDRDAAAAGGRTDVARALEGTTGAIGRDYGNFTSVALRGANAEHTVFALDGIRLNSAQNGTFDATGLPLSIADRIEVARGGYSAVYGSSPVGGVVNVTTPRPERWGALVRAGLGAFGRKYCQFGHTAWHQPVGYVVGGSIESAANDFGWTDSAGAARTRANADAASRSLFAKGVFRSGRHDASLLGEYGTSDRGDPGSVRLPSDSARRRDTRGIALLSWSFREADEAALAVRGYRCRFWQNYTNPDWSMNDTHDFGSLGIQVDQTVPLAGLGTAIAGFEAGSENLTSTSVSVSRRSTLAAWAQLHIRISTLTVAPVLRFERLRSRSGQPGEEQGTTYLVASPKVTLNWSPADRLDVYAGLGRSFRAPTFNDLYWPDDPFGYGNPLLEPEWSTGIDVGVTGRAPGFLRWRVGWHHTRLTDLIQWQPDTAWRYHPVNVDSAVISGLELDTELDLGPAGLEVGLDWLDARSGPVTLIYRPALSGRATAWARHRSGAVDARLGLTVEHAGRRFTDAANTDSLSLPAYTLCHIEAVARRPFRRVGTGVRFGIRNLLDARYQSVAYYPLPGRTWYGGLELGI